MKITSSYRLKFMIMTAVIISAVCAVLTFFSAQSIEETAVATFSERGEAILEEASVYVDGDRFQVLAESLDENDPYYRDTNQKLLYLFQSVNCEYLYCMAPYDEDNFVYVLDGSAPEWDEEEFSPIGTLEDISKDGPGIWNCIEKQEMTNSGIINQEDWGWITTIYQPIINSKGESVGVLCVDFDVDDIRAIIVKGTVRSIIVAVVALALGLLILLNGYRLFFKRLQSVTDRMTSIGTGTSNLSERLQITSDSEIDKLAVSCNSVMDAMQTVINKVADTIGVLSNNSKLLSDQNNETLNLIDNADNVLKDISGKADNQCQLTENVKSAIDDMGESIEAMNEKLGKQRDAVERSSAAIEEISASIMQADSNIQRIADEYSNIVKEAADGQQKQKQVSDNVDAIVKQVEQLLSANAVITRIASQTNLLAMNAAIEAAHAGDAGAGFAVVADEIRSLAETSSKQTSSIKKLIAEIRTAMADVVASSTASAMSFEKLGSSISSLDASVQEIKLGMQEQTSGAQDVLEMMRMLSNITSLIGDSSDGMKHKSMETSENVNNLYISADTILDNCVGAQNELAKMKEFAQSAAGQSEENLKMTAEIDDITSAYQTK
ncbi:MAG: hypothetical protein KBT02_01410 [Treponema sp.]|nr:hypothetical protein [Candidatus Treponema caballi]